MVDDIVEFTYRVGDHSNPVQYSAPATITITVTPSYYNPCDEATRAKIYYMPFPEHQDYLLTALRYASRAAGSTASTPSNIVRSVTGIKVPYPNTLIYYDHWEDGYEADITLPAQTSTQVWGDGNLTNGVAPGYPDDILPPGASINLDNNFTYNPRNPAVIMYDGRDKLYTTNAVAISMVKGDPEVFDNASRFTQQNLKGDVYDITRFGESFILPVGEDLALGGPNYTTASSFQYVSVFIRASENNTLVKLDSDGTGPASVQTRILNEGEVWFYQGAVPASYTASDGDRRTQINQPADIKSGATIIADKPVGVDMVFGSIPSAGYGTRNINVLPSEFYGHTYYSPIGHTGTTAAPVRSYFYNPSGSAITINVSWSSGSTSVNIPANSSGSYQHTQDSGYKFASTNGTNFTATTIIDDGANNSYSDWAVIMVAEERLTNFSSIAWAPGSQNNLPTENYNPIWVTPTANTTVYAKYDGNLTATGPNMTSFGLPYDVSFSTTALQSLRILNPSGDQTGMTIFTESTPFAAVYGQNPGEGTPPAGTALDVGNVLQPMCLQNLILAGDEYVVTDVDESIIIGVIQNDYSFLCNIDPQSIVIVNQPDNGTLIINPNGTITYTPDTGFNGIDQFDYRICSKEFVNTCDIANVRINVTPCEASLTTNRISGKTFLEIGSDNGQYDPGEDIFTGGVTVHIYRDANGNNVIDPAERPAIESIVSDLSGNYWFNVPTGSNIKDYFENVTTGAGATGGNGNNGLESFSTNWSKIVDTGNFTQNNVQIMADPVTGSYALRVGGTGNNGASRTKAFVDVTDAVIKFRYRRQDFANAGATILVQLVKPDNSVGYTYTINNLDGIDTDAYYTEVSQHLTDTQYDASGTHTIRIVGNGNIISNQYVYIEDVELYFAKSVKYIVEADTSASNGRYKPASGSTQVVVEVAKLEDCSKGIGYSNYLGVLADIDAINDNGIVNKDIPKTISILSNDLGYPDNASLSIVSQPTYGTVMVNPNGTVTYTPEAGYEGPDTFTYTICSMDDATVCDTATVTLNVQCVSIPEQNTINGLVYNDKNQDGDRDDQEAGRNGIPVQLYRDTNGNGTLDGGEPLVQTVNTDALGAYSFGVVPSGGLYRDNFNTDGTANGSNGTTNWSTSWQEIGESNGFGAGNVTITGGTLNITRSGNTNSSNHRGARRTANLSGVPNGSNDMVTLAYDWTRTGGTVQVGVANTNSTTDGDYTIIETINSGSSGSSSVRIPANRISANTTIRFFVNVGNPASFTFDNVVIETGSFSPRTYRDNFTTSGSGTGNNGTPAGNNFSGGWVELGEANGFNTGSVQVTAAGVLSIGSGTTYGASRTADLSGAIGDVTLTYTATRVGGSGTRTLTVYASSTSGEPYTQLTSHSNTANGSVTIPANLISATTTIRFRVTAGNSAYTVDNVQIAYNYDTTVKTYVAENYIVKLQEPLPSGWNISSPDAPYERPVSFAGNIGLGSCSNDFGMYVDADLEVTKSVNKPTPGVGENVVFTITAANNGPANATEVKVTDQLPSGYMMVSASPSKGSYDPVTGIWTIGNHDNGASATLAITAKVNSSGTYLNTATVEGAEYDPVSANNSASVTTTPEPRTDLEITKTVSKSNPYVDEDVTFTLTVKNNGPNDATGVEVTDVLPTGYTFKNAAPLDYNTTTGKWGTIIGNLANGASTSVTITATVKAIGNYANTASVIGAQTDPNMGNNSSSITPTPVETADLTIAKTISNASPSVGSVVTFTLTITNNGPSDATGISIEDVVPNGYNTITDISNGGSAAGNTITWSGISIANGSVITRTFKAKVLPKGIGVVHTNTATVGGAQYDPNENNNEDTQAVDPISGKLITNPMIYQKTKK